jgi:hypothetical protein
MTEGISGGLRWILESLKLGLVRGNRLSNQRSLA